MALKDLFIECAHDIERIKDNNWFEVKLDINVDVESGRLVLDYGPIHNNQYEQCIATITYELKGDVVLRNKMVHS